MPDFEVPPLAFPEDLRLVYGGRGNEREVPAHPESPTWIVNGVFERVQSVIDDSLAAYQAYCARAGIPHSYLLGLDILVTGELDSEGRVIDIKPTILEGPCCNSNPACPSIDSYRLYRRAVLMGIEPDRVRYPVHPTRVLETMIDLFRVASVARSGNSEPVIAVFTRSYAESEEETAHGLVLDAIRAAGLRGFRITPEEPVGVADGKLTVAGVPIDVCYRRIEAADVASFYGAGLAADIMGKTLETLYINPWEVDVLRSKAAEEECFRAYEAQGSARVIRPRTLIGSEITPTAMSEMMDRGGYAVKCLNSKGGRGVFLHFNAEKVRPVFDSLYGRYDGARMHPHAGNASADHAAAVEEAGGEVIVQQLRVIDARPIATGVALAYDMRINVMFDAGIQRWRILSGMSRCVPMGRPGNGNSLVTNVNAGAHLAPLIMGWAPGGDEGMTQGPLLASLARDLTSWRPV